MLRLKTVRPHQAMKLTKPPKELAGPDAAAKLLTAMTSVQTVMRAR
jgi:hypothetical protein